MSQMRSSLIGVGLTILTMLAGTIPVAAQRPADGRDPALAGAWRVLSEAERPGALGAAAWIRPDRYAAVRLNAAALEGELAAAPREFAGAPAAVISLPTPEGNLARFSYVESPLMAPELAAKFPEIRTFVGQGLDDRAASVRFDLTPAGFHAQVLSPGGSWYIDPLNRGDRAHYASYYKRDYRTIKNFQCLVSDEQLAPLPADTQAPNFFGEQLRTYDLAVAATGEYTAFHGGTVPAGLAAIVTSVNRVVGVYEREVAVRMVLVANNNLLVYTNSATDPYTNGSGTTMLGQNQTNIDAVIGSANYDIGHVVSTGGGGVASLGVVCTAGLKARGVTGSPSPVGDAFDIDYVAHEMGHQFAGNHSFNGVSGNCSGGNRNGSTAYEPGSGSTIMAYAGICGTDDLQPNSDAYFHGISFDEIRNFTNSGAGNGCPTITATGNTAPIVEAGVNYTIPINTPFELTAVGSDPDSDAVTYCWEQFNLGAAQALSGGDNGASPLFRSFNPTASPVRVFPRLSTILANGVNPAEDLPTTNRTMTFRCTIRDNRAAGGGVAFDSMSVTSTTSAGPFRVTAPNGGETVAGAMYVTWNVANTSGGSVNAPNVRITLSLDGGLTWPHLLAASTPNDGSELISLPSLPGLPSSLARVRVQGANHIFFDVSNANFTIQVPGAMAVLFPNGAPTLLAPGAATNVVADVVALSESPVAGGVTLNYRYSPGVFRSIVMNPIAPQRYQAALPAAYCTDAPQFYVSAVGNLGSVVSNPSNAPTGFLSASVGANTTAFSDNFQSDMGWTVASQLIGAGPFDGAWQRGDPVNNNRGDPPDDFNVGGLCYLTDNDLVNTNSDLDSGTTTLTSPAFSTVGGGTIAYAYWLNDVANGLLNNDSLILQVATDAGGTNWTTLRSYTTAQAQWRTDTIGVPAEVAASATTRIRFTASDLDPQNVVECGADNVIVTRVTCSTTVTCTRGDLNGDGVVNGIDVQAFVDRLVMGGSTAVEICAGDLQAGPDGVINTPDAGPYAACVLAGGCP